MRAYWVVALCAVGCGGSDDEPPPFTDVGGTLLVPQCGYTVTSRLGAEPPRKAIDFVGPDPTPRLVHLGIMGDPQTSMVVQWRTVDETTRVTEIRYARGADLTAEALTETADGIEFGYEATGTKIYRVHQVHLCDLEPGTTYSYQVGSKDHFSPVYSFRTAPDIAATPDAEVVFGFLGDSRDGYDIWAQLTAQVQQRTPDLVLFSGDAVTIGITQEEWEEFFGRAEPLLARVPIVFAHGNHEVNATPYYAQFAMPGDQQNFGFDYGHAHITVANDTPDDIGALTGSIVDFLREDFEASKDARWKLLMHHQPMWSASNHGSNLTLQQHWQPVVDQYHIDLVLNGHEHEFEITKPMIGQTPQASTENATVYVVAGGAGAELYDNGSDFWTQYSEKTHNAAVIRVRRDQLTLEAFRPDGTMIPAGLTKTKP
ncbi:MAG: metallophosphoesterase family protein [Deltaproteobacteria bacterium]|nr:metallophosphoesterase family protein [Deltaproteobacteria bacterium]MDQ3301220.1 metallophosphoesterase family protein [Myxococcota bacterium]